MKWYYAWRLNRVRAKISALEQEAKARLIEDYTAHSRARVLTKLANGLERRLARYQGPQQSSKQNPPLVPPPTEAC